MTRFASLRLGGRRAQDPTADASTRPAPVDAAAPAAPATPTGTVVGPSVAIAPHDPLFAILQSATGVVEVERLELTSPALDALRAGGIRLIVPLVAQGELVGALYLGPRLSDQEYSTDDRRLLSTLAAQAAPAIRVAQLVREQAAELQARERLEQEMRVATMIQQQFLPRELPDLPGWTIAAHYDPARAVGGDFYDFIHLPDGRIAVVVGDVTDKGVPAALIMARTQSVLRGEAVRLLSPSAVLAAANEILCPEMPSRMFVTCLMLVMDPVTGRTEYANAGHNLPYVRTTDGVVEWRATGMPLGLLPGMGYEQKEAVLEPGQSVLLYSDGLIEAHGPAGDMFGFPRLRELMADAPSDDGLLPDLLAQLRAFTGEGWEQEDDITLVALDRAPAGTADPGDPHGRVLLDLTLAGEAGNERQAMDLVADAVAPLALDTPRLERLKTAVSEAAMNAIEYGSRSDPHIPVRIAASVEGPDLVVRISDRALSGHVGPAEEPDLAAKLAGEQKPRGWGLFLIRHMVDEMDVATYDEGQTVTLTLHLEGAGDASQAVPR
jgi:serine phosphatase RsbU (regulator of sigma subunit)/anti-sigma regulatory factor (Ser/Thr protein kinase)